MNDRSMQQVLRDKLAEAKKEVAILEWANDSQQQDIVRLRDDLAYQTDKAEDADQYRLEAELELEAVKCQLEAIKRICAGMEVIYDA